MKLIPLTGGLFAKVDNDDYDRIRHYDWHLIHRKGKKQYASRTEPDGTNVYMHKEILSTRGRVNHKNGKCLDNRKKNLRVASYSQVTSAAIKKQKGKSSKYIGVSFAKHANKWRAHIMKDQVSKHLGYFSDEVAAAKAYDKASLENQGPFGVRNFA